ncbi:hypothetical protein PUMCH_000941 [Australozyma saopauloensis]|uniref:Uncharacterized protein n=1 Tax=Australozyma saopauloensis TaxID=291208 RepID=A0AAX4H5U4_9ASCO|nr:hypothetical protein PUMCH_000941 [[Candida] saopauloensis]
MMGAVPNYKLHQDHQLIQRRKDNSEKKKNRNKKLSNVTKSTKIETAMSPYIFSMWTPPIPVSRDLVLPPSKRSYLSSTTIINTPIPLRPLNLAQKAQKSILIPLPDQSLNSNYSRVQETLTCISSKSKEQVLLGIDYRRRIRERSAIIEVFS